MATATDDNGRSKKRKAPSANDNGDDLSHNCPYLDTVNRSALDFDFEPSCSVSLESGPHVYACLVCGKFFRGRGKHTPAHTHSVEEGHFIFVHLLKGTFHCLPDDYEVIDSSLADISASLHPTFSDADVKRLQSDNSSNTGLLARDLFGKQYLPGFVGLNNLNKTDYVNAAIQALAHVPPLRDFFLRRTHLDVVVGKSKVSKKKNKNNGKVTTKTKPAPRMSPLAQAFGELIRKMWSDKRFKSHVDPHMLIQAVSVASSKRFRVGQQAEIGEFMAWFLHQLHIGLGGTRKPGSSIIHEVFQGKVRVTTVEEADENPNGKEDENNKDDRGGSDAEDEDDGDGKANRSNQDQTMIDSNGKDDKATKETDLVETTTDTHFLQLSLDIPEKPLFRDEDGGLVIPQEPLVNVMKKFDGVTFADAVSRSGKAQQRKYQLLELPQYLILHLSRFKSNNYSREKNPTIVAFPVKNFDLSNYVHKPNGREKAPTEDEVRAMNVSWFGPIDMFVRSLFV